MKEKIQTLKRELSFEYFLFRNINIIADLAVWVYYYILIYNETNSISALLLERIVFMLSIWGGFIISSLFLDKLGYLSTYRLSSLIQAVSIFLILIFIKHIAVLLIPLAVLRGIGRGTYWPVDHGVMVNEIHGKSRGAFINTIMSMELLLSIIIPIFAGSIISLNHGYEYIFILGIIVNLFGTFLPFKYNLKKATKFSTGEIRRIYKKPFFKEFTFVTFFDQMSSILQSTLFLIVPYLILKNEFDLGLLLSFAAVVSAFFGFIKRDMTHKLKVKIGMAALSIFVFTEVIFTITWNSIFLIFRSGTNSFYKAMGASTKQDIDYRLRESILDKDIFESSVELNVIVETLYLIARIITLGVALFLLEVTKENVETIIRILIIVAAIGQVIGYILFINLENKIKVK